MIHDEHADLDVAYSSKRKMIIVMLMVVEVLHGIPKYISMCFCSFGLFSSLVAFFISSVLALGG